MLVWGGASYPKEICRVLIFDSLQEQDYVKQNLLQGRLCADPELRTTQSGVAVASFRVAWSEKYKETETKLFLPCTAWRGTGEFVSKYFRKGQEIIVEGPLSTREYTDKEGNKRTVTELTVDKAHFCGPKQEGGTSNTYQPAGAPVNVQGPEFTELDDDDGELPF
jgi:single-strand DNA-binding protein